jgi:hypothetical protein
MSISKPIRRGRFAIIPPAAAAVAGGARPARFGGRATSPLAVLAAVLLLAACGGGNKSTAPAGSAATAGNGQAKASKLYDLPDPCALLTRADAEAAVGEPMEKDFTSGPAPAGPGIIPSAECNYGGQTRTAVGTRTGIGLKVKRHDSAEAALIGFDTVTCAGLRKQSGIGDAACVGGLDTPADSPVNDRGGAVRVANLTIEFGFQPLKAKVRDPDEALARAMKQVVDRLPSAPTLAVPSATPGAAAQAPAITATPTATQAATVRPATPAATQPAPAATGGSVGLPAPCALLTKEEAAAALGEAVEDGKPASVTTPIGQALACEYNAVASPRYVKVQVDVAATMSAAQLRQFAEAAIARDNRERLPGYGDLAAWYPSMTGKNELQILKGNRLITVQVFKGFGRDSSEEVKAVARKVLERLP